MSDNPERAAQNAYLDACDAFDAAERAIEAVSKALAVAAEMIGRPNTATGYETGGRLKAQPGGAWIDHLPDAETVRKAMVDWTKARATMLAAWRSIPDDQRKRLVPPLYGDR